MIEKLTKLQHIAPLLWNDLVTIYGFKPVKNSHGITNNQLAIIIEDEPAKLILKDLKTAKQSYFVTDNYDAKLLIRTGIKIPAGAKIKVTDVHGNITNYKLASKGFSGYVSHQEVALVHDDKAIAQ